MGGKPVPAEAVQDDHVLCPQLNYFSREQRDPVVLEVYINDLVWPSSSTGGHGGLHVGGHEEVSRQP